MSPCPVVLRSLTIQLTCFRKRVREYTFFLPPQRSITASFKKKISSALFGQFQTFSSPSRTPGAVVRFDLPSFSPNVSPSLPSSFPSEFWYFPPFFWSIVPNMSEGGLYAFICAAKISRGPAKTWARETLRVFVYPLVGSIRSSNYDGIFLGFLLQQTHSSQSLDLISPAIPLCLIYRSTFCCC